MELTDSKGQPLKKEEPFQIAITKSSAGKNADRDALKRVKGADQVSIGKPKFDNMHELEEKAEELYSAEQNAYIKLCEKEKALGFDVTDPECIKTFKINYTPVGDTLLVKFIREEKMAGKLLLIDGSNESKKAIVMVPGLLVNTVFRGDIVTMKPTDRLNPFPPSVKRRIADIEFEEISYQAVGGVFKDRVDVIKRIQQDDPSKAAV